MSQEVTVQCSLSIRKQVGNVVVTDFRPQPTSFKADQEGYGGPTPGLLTVPLMGTAISLAQLTTPGFARFINQGSGDSAQDSLCYIEIGVKDQSSNTFIPLFELYPGETYVLRLSRFLGQQFGTATSATTATGADIQLYAKSVTYVQKLVAEVMER